MTVTPSAKAVKYDSRILVDSLIIGAAAIVDFPNDSVQDQKWRLAWEERLQKRDECGGY